MAARARAAATTTATATGQQEDRGAEHEDPGRRGQELAQTVARAGFAEQSGDRTDGGVGQRDHDDGGGQVLEMDPERTQQDRGHETDREEDPQTVPEGSVQQRPDPAEDEQENDLARRGESASITQRTAAAPWRVRPLHPVTGGD